MEHGKRYTYVHLKCRCALCKSANAAYSKKNHDANRESRLAQRREWSEKRREELGRIKVERGCAKCGYNEHPAALDFHHANGDKSFGIASSRNLPWDKLLSEIDKCTVLCANCHRVEHTMNWHSSQIASLNFYDEEEEV